MSHSKEEQNKALVLKALQDEVTRAESKSGLPMFGDSFVGS
jgi:hypothetical protein